MGGPGHVLERTEQIDIHDRFEAGLDDIPRTGEGKFPAAPAITISIGPNAACVFARAASTADMIPDVGTVANDGSCWISGSHCLDGRIQLLGITCQDCYLCSVFSEAFGNALANTTRSTIGTRTQPGPRAGDP